MFLSHQPLRPSNTYWMVSYWEELGVTAARLKSHVFPCCYSVNIKGVKEPDVMGNIEHRSIISKKCKYPLSNLLTRFILVGQYCRTDRKGKCVFQSEGKPLVYDVRAGKAWFNGAGITEGLHLVGHMLSISSWIKIAIHRDILSLSPCS